MSDDSLKWEGVISENTPSGKSIKIIGQKDGKNSTFRLGADLGAGPQVGQLVELKYRISRYTGQDGKPAESKWISNWKPLQASLPEVRRHNGADTIPTVLEQFVKEVVGGWAHAGQLGQDSESVQNAIRACVYGWRSAKGAEKPTVPATGPDNDELDAPPPASEEAYGAKAF